MCIDVNGEDVTLKYQSPDTDFIAPEMAFFNRKDEIARYEGVLSDYIGTPNRQATFTIVAADFNGYEHTHCYISAEIRLWSEKGVDIIKEVSVKKSGV